VTSREFLIAIALGLMVRVATLPLQGHDDVAAWKIWSYAAAGDVTAVYGVGGTPPTRGIVTWRDQSTTVNYPPLFLYEYAAIGRLYGALFPGFPDTPALLIALKLPILFAGLGLTTLLFVVVRRVSGRDEPAQWAALAYWLNPATIVGGEMLGYVDALCFLPAIAGLALAYFNRPVWGGVLVALAVATKPQGLLIGPAFAVAVWQAGRLPALARAGAAFAATLALVTLPFFLRGALPNMWLAFASFDSRRDTLSAYAANIGWIVNWALRGWFGVAESGLKAFLQPVPRPLSVSRVVELGFPNPKPIGRAAVIAATAWAMWRVARKRDLAATAALGAFTTHAFFVMATGVHEHLQLLEVPLLVLAAALCPALRPLLFVVSAIVTLNIGYVNVHWGSIFRPGLTGIDFCVLLAFVNVGTFVWFGRRLFSGVTSERDIQQWPPA